MKIVIDPPDLQAVASRFVDASADFEQLSLRLRGAPRPELPAGFGDLDATIASVSQSLQGQSNRLLQEAARLRERAVIAQLGAAVASALRDPRYEDLSGKALHNAIEEDPNVKAALAALSVAGSVTDLVAGSRKWERLEQIATARGGWNAFVSPNLLHYGQDDYRTFRGYMLWQERMSHSMPLDFAKQSMQVVRGSRAEEELASETGPLVGLGKVGKVLDVGGKGLMGVDVLANGYTLIKGSEYGGVRGDVDRGMAGAGFAASGTMGVHDFRLCASTVAAGWLAAFADSDDAARTGGDPLDARGAIEAAVGVPDSLTRVFAVRQTDDDRPSEWEATLASSRTGLWVVVEGVDGTVEGWPLAPEERTDLFERLLDPDR